MRELAVLNKYLAENGLNRTAQRETILKEFLALERHVSVQELAEAIRRKHKDLGHATVFRALKLFSDAGLARVVDLGDGLLRYEHGFEHGHHDHLICRSCGRTEEFCSPDIERLQDEIGQKHGFMLTGHRLDLYGTCRDCAKKSDANNVRRGKA